MPLPYNATENCESREAAAACLSHIDKREGPFARSIFDVGTALRMPTATGLPLSLCHLQCESRRSRGGPTFTEDLDPFSGARSTGYRPLILRLLQLATNAPFQLECFSTSSVPKMDLHCTFPGKYEPFCWGARTARRMLSGARDLRGCGPRGRFATKDDRCDRQETHRAPHRRRRQRHAEFAL